MKAYMLPRLRQLSIVDTDNPQRPDHPQLLTGGLCSTSATSLRRCWPCEEPIRGMLAHVKQPTIGKYWELIVDLAVKVPVTELEVSFVTFSGRLFLVGTLMSTCRL